PQCPICPWIPYCRAHKEDDPLAYPKSNKRKKTAEKYQVCLLVLDPEQRLLLRQRPEKGLLAGLWEPLGTALFEKPFKAPLKESIKLIKIKKTASPTPLKPVRHIFTHFKLTVTPFQLQLKDLAEKAHFSKDHGLWYPLEAWPSIPMATLHRKMVTQLTL
ncbi:NUDIX domain-containing protein, partial [Magnetococcales bacterium HHB-1]